MDKVLVLAGKSVDDVLLQSGGHDVGPRWKKRVAVHCKLNRWSYNLLLHLWVQPRIYLVLWLRVAALKA